MREILRFRDVLLYSDKDVKEAKGDKVLFMDGSVANLTDLAIKNIGKGHIQFEIVEELVDSTVRKSMQVNSSYIELIGGNFNVELLESDDGISKVEIIGTNEYANLFKVYDLSGGVRIETPRESGSIVINSVIINGKREPNTVEGVIRIHTNSKSSLYIENNGGGKIKLHKPISKLITKVTGSLDVNAKTIDKLDVKISGSGSVEATEVLESANIKISGSGDVTINKGNLTDLKVNISGTGTVCADVSVDYAELLLSGSGRIVVKHVLKESIEVHQGSGFIKVNERD